MYLPPSQFCVLCLLCKIIMLIFLPLCTCHIASTVVLFGCFLWLINDDDDDDDDDIRTRAGRVWGQCYKND